MAVFEDSSDLDCELFPADIAFVQSDSIALALEPADSLFTLAMRANGAIGPKPGFDIGVCGFFIVKTWIR